jgi:hypothetical protein
MLPIVCGDPVSSIGFGSSVAHTSGTKKKFLTPLSETQSLDFVMVVGVRLVYCCRYPLSSSSLHIPDHTSNVRASCTHDTWCVSLSTQADLLHLMRRALAGQA